MLSMPPPWGGGGSTGLPIGRQPRSGESGGRCETLPEAPSGFPAERERDQPLSFGRHCDSAWLEDTAREEEAGQRKARPNVGGARRASCRRDPLLRRSTRLQRAIGLALGGQHEK